VTYSQKELRSEQAGIRITGIVRTTLLVAKRRPVERVDLNFSAGNLFDEANDRSVNWKVDASTQLIKLIRPLAQILQKAQEPTHQRVFVPLFGLLQESLDTRIATRDGECRSVVSSGRHPAPGEFGPSTRRD
jgi:hypothetical protein